MSEFVKGWVLGIETGGRLTGASLVKAGRLVSESAIDIDASRQEFLFRLIDRQLAEHEIELSDLSRLGISLGPGSFTGLRVGLAGVRALSLGSQIPVVPVPSHEALAYPYCDLGRTIVVLTGMRRGEVCVEVGKWRHGFWDRLFRGSVPAPEVHARISDQIEGAGPLLFIGEAVESGLEACPSLEGLGSPIRNRLAIARRPGPIALLASREEVASLDGETLMTTQPLYFREADAKKPGVDRAGTKV